MMIFKWLWLIILIIPYIIWTTGVFISVIEDIILSIKCKESFSEIIEDISFNDNFISWISIHIMILFFASIVCFALGL